MIPTVDLLIFFLAAAGSSDLDNEDLYAMIKQGDQNAFRLFFDRHYDRLFSFLMSRNIQSDVAEDLIQKAFIYIWEHRDNIEPQKSLRSYLFRIAYTRMLNHVKSDQKFTDNELDIQVSEGKNPESNIEYKELKSALDKAVQLMPEKRRMVFTNCFINEFTYKETAKILGIAEKTVENHMALAFKDVRQALNNFNQQETE